MINLIGMYRNRLTNELIFNYLNQKHLNELDRDIEHKFSFDLSTLYSF